MTHFSVTYGWSGITVVAPKPSPLPGLVVPLLPFSKGMWVAVCIYVALAALLLYSLSNATDRLLGKYHTLGQHSRKNYCDDNFASRRTSHAFPQSAFLSERQQISVVQSRTPPDLGHQKTAPYSYPGRLCSPFRRNNYCFHRHLGRVGLCQV